MASLKNVTETLEKLRIENHQLKRKMWNLEFMMKKLTGETQRKTSQGLHRMQ